MAQALSKSDRIRKVLHLSNAEIAERIGCRPEYVRTVRQRTSKNGNPRNSQATLAYKPTRLRRMRERYASDPEFRARKKAQFANWYYGRRAESRAP